VMKRIVCLLLGLVILLSLAAPAVFATEAAAESTETTEATEPTGGVVNQVLKTSDECLRILKLEEGFSKKPYWDYTQWTVGYGSRCPDDKLEEYKANGIPESEAEALLRDFLTKFESEINGFMIRSGKWLDQKQFDALLLFSYNCGSSWAYDTDGLLYTAVANGEPGSVLVNAFVRWCNAGGQVQSYLLRRRLSEVNIYFNGEYSQTPSDKYGYVLYDANGGTVKPNVQGYDVAETAKPAPVPTKNGATFLGWYTAVDGGKRVKYLDSSVRNTRLYARWDDEKLPEEEVDGVEVTVTANGVNIRSGPGVSYSVKGTVNTGDRLVITDTKFEDNYLWGQFKNGWVCLNYTNYDFETQPEEQPEETQKRMGTVKVNDALNVRKGPGTGYAAVTQLKNGTRVEILEEKIVGATVWGRIAEGWISMDYVVMDPEKSEESEETEDPTEPTVPETEPPETEPSETEPPETEPPSESEEETTVKLTGTIKVGDQLRIRKGPSTNDAVVGYYKNGDRVTVTERTVSGSMTWGKTDKGWISLDYFVADPVEDEEEEENLEDGVVKVSDFLRVRSGPGTSYAITAYLANGTRVKVTERKNIGGTQWGKIDKGWISLSYVTFETSAKPPVTNLPVVPQTKTVTADCLRVRKSAGVDSAIVAYLYNGAKVEILETKTVNGMTWGRIAKGWISMDYVK